MYFLKTPCIGWIGNAQHGSKLPLCYEKAKSLNTKKLSYTFLRQWVKTHLNNIIYILYENEYNWFWSEQFDSTTTFA